MKEITALDWNVYHINYKKVTEAQKKFMIKVLTGWLPVYHHLNKMTQEQRLCPLCQQEETISHLFQCRRRNTWKTQFRQSLRTKLQHLDTPQELTNKVMNTIQERLHEDHNTSLYQYIMFAGLIPRDWAPVTNKSGQPRSPSMVQTSQLLVSSTKPRTMANT